MRERDVTPQRGMGADRQPILYEEKLRDKCLVEIAQAVGGWCRGVTLAFHLLPPEFATAIAAWLRRSGFRSTYTLFKDGRETPEAEGRIVPQPGGLYLYATGVPIDALIRIQVQAGGMSWVSKYEPLGSRSISLEQEP